MSALSTVAGARSARQSRDAGGGRDATGRPGKQPPFRGGHRGPWLLLAGQRQPSGPCAADTRASTKAGVGPVVANDVLIATTASLDLVEVLVVANASQDYRDFANAGKAQIDPARPTTRPT